VLDSSNNQSNQETPFDANAFFNNLCVDTKILVPGYAEIQFQRGWAEIVAEFIGKVKNYSIRIDEISDSYTVLDISFSVIKTNREVEVWRAANEARITSKSTCAGCGNHKGFRRIVQTTNVLCQWCLSNAHLTNNTGTWLDKY